MLGLPRLIRRLPRPRRTATELRISYEDGRGLLRTILVTCTGLQFAVNHVRLEESPDPSSRREAATDLADTEGTDLEPPAGKEPVTLVMQVKGKRPISDLIASLGGIGGVHEIGTIDADLALE